MATLHTERLYEVLGQERPCDEVARLLRSYVHEQKPPVVGAMRVTCSDEAEQEVIEAFQRQFVRYLLPDLKFSAKSPFRTANLGSRYEWGAIRIAENHYALASGAEDWKIVVLKINAHVSVERGPDGHTFGAGARYDGLSPYCGALAAVLEGSSAPFAQAIVADFAVEDASRLDQLRDPKAVSPELRSLYAAVLHARLQARRAMVDVQDYTPDSPTLYFVLPCVTLNQTGHDTEIVCGIYAADRRGSESHDEYCGLGDDPLRYRYANDGGMVALSDPDLHTPRHARNHREHVKDLWHARGDRLVVDERAKLVLAASRKSGAPGSPLAKAALGTVLTTLIATSPIPAAVVLFGEGLVQIHHASKAHALARAANDDEAARAMLSDLEEPLSRLSPEEAQHLLHLLATQYGV